VRSFTYRLVRFMVSGIRPSTLKTASWLARSFFTAVSCMRCRRNSRTWSRVRSSSLGGALNFTPSAFSICGMSSATLSAKGPFPTFARARHAVAASAMTANSTCRRIMRSSCGGTFLPRHLDAGHEPDDARDVMPANHDAFLHQAMGEIRLERRQRTRSRRACRGLGRHALGGTADRRGRADEQRLEL